MTRKRTWRNVFYSAWDAALIRLLILGSTLRSKLSLRWQGCTYGRGFSTSGCCAFKARTDGSIRIGEHVSLLAAWRTNRVGLSNPVLLETFGEGRIEIGDHSGGSSVVLSSRSEITIGRHVKLGGNVRIFDHDFHPLEPEPRRAGSREQAPHVRTDPVRIGNDVFVGAQAMVLKGVTLGDRVLVAAGAVVFKGEYPPDCILAGNPAVIVRRKSTAPGRDPALPSDA